MFPSLKRNWELGDLVMKKSKGPLWPRFIKRFYGINGALDEYREQEVTVLEINYLSCSYFLNLFQQLLPFSWALSGKYQLKFFSTATLLSLFLSCQWLWWQCWPIETYRDLLKSLEISLRKSVKKLRKKAGLIELFLPFLCLFLTCFSNGKKVKILLKSCSILSS